VSRESTRRGLSGFSPTVPGEWAAGRARTPAAPSGWYWGRVGAV
jgi:hypothetical protein